jgi:nucleoside-diphosphate-sugar epimerase
MNVLVTGATGFIGSRLVTRLVKHGEQVNILCRETSDISLFSGLNIRIHHGDILDDQSIEAAMTGCDRVYHLAAIAKNWAPNADIYYRNNVLGTENILKAARNQKIRKVVITSTSLIYGPSNGTPINENVQKPQTHLTDYVRSKALADHSISNYIASGLNIVIVCPTRLFGPGLMTEGNSVTMMIDLYLQGKWRLILGNGDAIGNYAYIDDVVMGHIQAMETGKTGESYILGGENLSFNEFFDIVTDLSQKSYRFIHLPLPLALGFGWFEQNRAKLFKSYPLITPEWVKLFAKDWAYSSEKAKSELGYRVTPFEDAIHRTINWLKNG